MPKGIGYAGNSKKMMANPSGNKQNESGSFPGPSLSSSKPKGTSHVYKGRGGKPTGGSPKNVKVR